MSRVTFLAILLSLLASTVIGCREQETGVLPPELKDRIVYVSEEGICTINPEGTDLKVTVSSEKGGPSPYPKWSPDKRRIAFNGKVDGSARIMMVNPDGSELKILTFPEPKKEELKPGEKRLTWGKYDMYFCGWSPSGRHVLYYQPIIDGAKIGVISRQGEMKADLSGFNPCFAGEDSIVYLEADLSGRTSILGFDLYTYKRHKISKRTQSRFYFPLVCSNDGKVAFAWETLEKRDELWVTDFSGSESIKLASLNGEFTGGNLSVIMFSPNGDQLLFIPNAGSKSEIYVIGTDGTGLRKITDSIVKANGGVSWSPDGKGIVFVSVKDGNDELYVANVDGTGLKRLTNNNIKDCCPDW